MKNKIFKLLLVAGVLIVGLAGCSVNKEDTESVHNEDVPIEQTLKDEAKKSPVKDSLYGFVVGDAMGVPIEFKDREMLMKDPVKSMLGHGTYNVPEGTWSDDTSMTLATMDSIIKNGKTLDYNDMADRFCNWLNNAEYTATNEMFDVGNATKAALLKYQENKIDAIECGGKELSSNGNGSLMRMLPVAFYCYNENLNDEEILNVVKNVSSITHAHERSVMGCYIYVRYFMYLLDGKEKFEAYDMIKQLDYSMFSEEARGVYSRILEEDISKLKLDDVRSTGYVVYTLESVFWVILNNNTYNESIIKAINLGEDTDTVGAITGSLAGLIYGYDSINDEWLIKLKNKEYLDKIIFEFENTLVENNEK